MFMPAALAASADTTDKCKTATCDNPAEKKKNYGFCAALLLAPAPTASHAAVASANVRRARTPRGPLRLPHAQEAKHPSPK